MVYIPFSGLRKASHKIFYNRLSTLIYLFPHLLDTSKALRILIKSRPQVKNNPPHECQKIFEVQQSNRSSFLKESILFILNQDYAEEDE
jgi:hypothetical protein